MNEDGSLVAVGDFAGNVAVLETHCHNIAPKPVKKVNVGMPVRALVWCHKKNLVVIGCVGGSLFAWNVEDEDAVFIDQL
jgi:hypothetical protein